MAVPAVTLRTRIEQSLRIEAASKPRLYIRILESSNVSDVNYWLELFLSAGIATLGLVLNSPAVVIGAMLISPLMGPILAAGLALAAGDLYLGLKSLVNLAASVAGAVAFSALLVILLPFQSPTAEILSRTRPNLLDLGVAIFSGLAGSMVVCRGGTGGGVTALPGVAIAVALMPPLCTVGFGAGAGFLWPIISGAGLLFLTNLAAIVASAFLVFLVVRMDAPDVRGEIDRSIRAASGQDRLYGLLQRTFLARSLADVGKLRWRVLMLMVVLAVLFVPLSRALNQVREETVARTAVRDALRQLAARDDIVSEGMDLGGGRIRVRVITTVSVPRDRVEKARQTIMRRTGRDVDLYVRKVAGEEELASLREQLKPAPAPAAPQDLESMRAELLQRLEGPLAEAWPAELGTLTGYELGFSAAGLVVHLKYEGEKPLDEGSAAILRQVLGSRLRVAQVRLDLEHVTHESPPAPPTPKARAAARR